MKILHINVADKIATYRKRDGDIVGGNSDYVIHFTFDSEWDTEGTLTARFIWNGMYEDVEFTGTECEVPIIHDADKVEVGVYQGDLSTTTRAVIGCKRSILCGGVSAQAAEAKKYKDDIVQLASQAAADAEAAGASEEAAQTSAEEAAASAESAARDAALTATHAKTCTDAEANARQDKDEAQTAAVEAKTTLANTANALKGYASGANVCVDDVSPRAHTVRVRVRGKNLYNIEGRTERSLGGYHPGSKRALTGDGIYFAVSGSNYYEESAAEYSYDSNTNALTLTTKSVYYGLGIDIAVEPSTVYTVTGEFSENSVFVVTQYDAEGRYLSFVHCKSTSFTTAPNASWIIAILASTEAQATITAAKIQIEKGGTATNYEPPIDPTGVSVVRYGIDGTDGKQTFTSPSSGMVEIPSISPKMHIITETANILVEVEYHRDANVVIAELVQAIRSSGGSV